MTDNPADIHAEDGENDSYLASMSDLMVGMLFIFIIMLMAFALNFRQAEDENLRTLDDAILLLEEVARKNEILEKGRLLVSENQALRDRMLTRMRGSLKEQGVDVSIEESGVLRLRDGLPFGSGDADLTGVTLKNAKALARVLELWVPCYSIRPDTQAQDCPRDSVPVLEAIFVEGHTDDQPISGKFRDNWALSTARAANTYEVLKSAAPGLTALRNASGKALFGVSGYGEERPLVANDSEKNRSLNRRIDIRFLLASPSPEQIDRIQREADQPH